MSSVPAHPKIFHIVHVDRLASIVAKGLLPDAVMQAKSGNGTTIGMSGIKQRRLTLPIQCRPGLHVGDCVPFYFCPRSIMLFVIHCANHPELAYRGGQGPIIHLQADLRKTVAWAERHGRRWAFTLSNAGAYYFEDRCEVGQLGELNWQAIQTDQWAGLKEGKQAEFLLEQAFPWELVERIVVLAAPMASRVMQAFGASSHRPPVEVRREWYY